MGPLILLYVNELSLFVPILFIADLYFMHAQFPVDAANSSAGIRIVYGKGGG